MENRSFSIRECEHALILGAGAIGSALAREIHRINPGCRIFATKRVFSPCPENLPESARVLELDPRSERSWSYFAQALKEETSKLDLIVCAFGVLHNENVRPEKKLEDITLEGLTESFTVNAFAPVLAAKNLLPFLSRDRTSVFAFLSARLGSISDDHLGGWHSYRASKAALNMFVKNIALEFKNRRLKTVALAIHPGTTDSKLSRPYLSGTGLKVWTPEETAGHLVEVIEAADPKHTGHFENWDGSELPY